MKHLIEIDVTPILITGNITQEKAEIIRVYLSSLNIYIIDYKLINEGILILVSELLTQNKIDTIKSNFDATINNRIESLWNESGKYQEFTELNKNLLSIYN